MYCKINGFVQEIKYDQIDISNGSMISSHD